jgi:hypothetical protein
MKDLLFKTNNKDTNRRDLYLILNDNNDIILSGYDSGPIVKKFYDDFDYEYSLTLNKKNQEIFNDKIIKGNVFEIEKNIINYIKKEYSHENGFFQFKEMLDSNNIEYKFLSF